MSASGETLTGRARRVRPARARSESEPPPRFRMHARGADLRLRDRSDLRPTNGYWTVAFVALVSSPAIANSELEALRRILAALLGGAAAAAVVIGAYDLPWLYVLLQAVWHRLWRCSSSARRRSVRRSSPAAATCAVITGAGGGRRGGLHRSRLGPSRASHRRIDCRCGRPAGPLARRPARRAGGGRSSPWKTSLQALLGGKPATTMLAA